MEFNGSPRSEFDSTDASLRRLARRLAARSTDAEDLAQEVWLAALRRPALLAQREWYRIVARRTFWRWTYRERARSALEREIARPESQEVFPDAVETASLREYLFASVSALKEPYREVIRLHYFEDLSVEEIGRRLGRPRVTVRVQLSRGLELLRSRLEGKRRRFLGLSGLPSLFSSWLRPRWLQRADRRMVALGATAVVGAVALLVVVPGRADRDREAWLSPVVVPRPVASLEAPENQAWPDRIPLQAGETGQVGFESASIRIGGRVLSFDGKPIAGAPVFLRDPRGSSRLVAMSGEDGRYEVVSAGLEDWIEARPEGSLPTPPHLVCSVEEGLELDLVTTRPAGNLRGRVRDAEGNPVPGAEVVLRTPLTSSRVGSLLATTLRDELTSRASFGVQATVEGELEPTRCLTDGAGRFEAPKPPEQRFLVLVNAPGLPPGLELVEAREGEGEDGVDEEIEIRLAVPARIAGRVLDRDGRACGGARLELLFPEPRPRQETRTDESGRYRFDGLGAGPFVLRLLERPDGNSSCHVEGRIASGQPLPLDIELSEGSSLWGTVATDGRPLEGWTVALREIVDRDFPGRDSREARTASDGRFAFLGCTLEEYDLEFFHPDTPRERHRVRARAGQSPLALEPRPSELVAFRGRIVRRAGAPQPSLLGIAAVRGNTTGSQTLVAIDAETGEFSGPSLPRERYHVDAFFPGSATAWRKTIELDGRERILEVPGRGSLRLEVELPPDASFAQASAFVRVRAPLATYWIHAPMPRDPGLEAFVTELMPGTYWVIVLLEGHAAECLKAKVEEGRETRLTVAPKKGTPVTLQVVAPRPLADGEILHLEVEETERRVPVPFFREAPGESAAWWAGVELTADARRLRATTTAGLAGELVLTADLVHAGAILRIELEAQGSARR